jgi:hypothetical protein
VRCGNADKNNQGNFEPRNSSFMRMLLIDQEAVPPSPLKVEILSFPEPVRQWSATACYRTVDNRAYSKRGLYFLYYTLRLVKNPLKYIISAKSRVY